MIDGQITAKLLLEISSSQATVNTVLLISLNDELSEATKSALVHRQ